MSYTPHVTGSEAEMKLRYDLNSMSPGILVSPRLPQGQLDPRAGEHHADRGDLVRGVHLHGGHADLTLTGGLNSFTLRGSVATIRALLTDAIAVLDQVQADGITRFKVKE